ncbi:MAG: YbjQ family protein [Candidatus Melainabacteria bacterium]|nr:YbjQ family protein [Candidatus Melainabacteria bacterium]
MHKLAMILVCLIAYSTPALAANSGTESQARPVDLLISTTPSLEGYRIKEYLGVVRGVTVRQPTIGQGLSASLERLKGGHISAYVAMCNTARQQAYDICLENARALKADALVGMAYDSCGFDASGSMQTEVVCYGTAVTIERNVATKLENAGEKVSEATDNKLVSAAQISEAKNVGIKSNTAASTAASNAVSTAASTEDAKKSAWIKN